MDLVHNEDWNEIDGYSEWIVSSQGRVMNEWTRRIMKPRLNQQELLMVGITRNNKQDTRLVSLLVARAFLDSPRNSDYNSVIHLNGDRTDCRALNLMWRPRWFAIKFHKMFDDDPIRVAVEIPKIKEVYHSLREACTTYGLIEKTTYIDMINGDPCFHYGWIFERYEE